MEEQTPGQTGQDGSQIADMTQQPVAPESPVQVDPVQAEQAAPAPQTQAAPRQNLEDLVQSTPIPPIPPVQAEQAAPASPEPQFLINPMQSTPVAPAFQSQAAVQQPQGNPVYYTQVDPAQMIQPDMAAQPQPAPRQVQGHPVQYTQIDPTQQPVYTVMDPNTGQLYYTYVPPIMPQVSVREPTLEEIAVLQQAQAPPQDYGQVMKRVEEFAEGDASVGDVLKTLYTTTAQDDQFWKGALVGAAAAVLLTSETVKGAMGRTLGTILGGGAGAAAVVAADDGSEPASEK